MTEKRDQYSARALLVTALIAVIGTVLALDFYGLIQHNNNKQATTVGDFRAIYLKAGEGHRLSPKPSNVHIECQNDYVVIASDADPHMKGLLVDYRNRGIRCVPVPPASANKENTQ